MTGISQVDRGDGVRLAVRHHSGRGPALLFLPGYMSDMTGTKAEALFAWAQAQGRGCILMDYSGCGQSAGEFSQGSIRRWAADARAVIDALAPGPVLAIGSSMGGWVMLHLALGGARLAGLVGIAAAPDFTEWGLPLTDKDVETLAHQGFVERPSGYADSPYHYHRALLDDAEGARLLGGPIPIHLPVRLLHGMADADVPFEISIRLAERLQSPDVQVTLLKNRDHRLSNPDELALLLRTIEEFPCA